jgi:hypothetical protein
VADDCGTHAWDRAILFIGEQSRVRERQRDVPTRANGRRQSDQDVQRIHRVAAKPKRFAICSFYLADDEVGMKFDADGAGNVGGSKVDLRDGAEGLVRGVEGRGDIIMVR